MQKKSLFFFSLPSAINFGEAKVTESRVKYKTNAFVFISETKYLRDFWRKVTEKACKRQRILED